GPPCPTDRLVLQVSAQELLEGDTVTLRCRGWRHLGLTQVRFYREEKDLGGALKGTELSLSPMQLRHGGRYRCGGLVTNLMSQWWEESAPVTVTVHGENPHPNAPT
ncbi:FCRLA protein, partial [Calyptomena viridis]|nr:FCRLA protein [Calyptomena viridis]